jgi:CheY-like chemotaxis protein
MNQGGIKVLLMGEDARGSSFLSRHLEQRGCQCWFATSTEEGLSLAARHAFHLVLSTSPMQQANPILSLLTGSDCSVFYCLPLEDSCWWLPLVRNGQKCLGAPALRPSEFVGLLDEVLREIDLNGVTALNQLQEV